MYYSISLTIGTILLILSLYILKETLTFVQNSRRAIGVVTEYEEQNGEGGVTYLPIFKIKTCTNEVFTYRHHTSSSPPDWKIGEEETFLYNPSDPDSARLFTYFGVFSWTIILMSVSLPLIVFGGGYYLSQPYLR